MNRSARERGLAHLYLLVFFLILALTYAFSNFRSSSSQYSQNPKVLSKEGESESSGSSSGSNSSGGESSNNSSGSSSSSTETKVNREKTEIRFSESEKIKTEVRDDRTRIDVYSGGVKVRYELKDGKLVVKGETQQGEGVAQTELFKIEDRLDKTGIKITTAGGEMFIVREGVGAQTGFPVQIDLSTNELIASTSTGSRVLTTLPDQAVQNLIAANVISRLGPPFLRESLTTNNLAGVSDIISLGEKNGIPVYEINGLKDQRLFGFIPVTTSVKVFVSAENGQVVSQEKSLLGSLVDLF